MGTLWSSGTRGGASASRPSSGSAITGSHSGTENSGAPPGAPAGTTLNPDGTWKAPTGQEGTGAFNPSGYSNSTGYDHPFQNGGYVSDIGVQPGQSQAQFEGLDFTKRGPAEQQWLSQGGTYNTPTFGETNTQNIVQSAQQPQQTNNTQTYFDQFNATRPSVATEPGFGAYFDNAKDRAAESINRSTAATGTYGSSSANDQTSRAFTDLEGQRALKEADYNLARLGEERAWEGLGGSLAGASDQQSLANSQDDQNWAGLLSKLGIDASRLGLERTNAGFDAANVAGNAERTRGQDYFNNEAASGDRFADLIRSIMGPALDNDADLFGVENSGGVAGANARVGQEQQNTQNGIGALNTGLAAYNEYSK